MLACLAESVARTITTPLSTDVRHGIDVAFATLNLDHLNAGADLLAFTRHELKVVNVPESNDGVGMQRVVDLHLERIGLVPCVTADDDTFVYGVVKFLTTPEVDALVASGHSNHCADVWSNLCHWSASPARR